MNLLRNEKIAVSGSVISFVFFAALLRLSGVSAGTAVNLQNDFLLAFLASSPLSVAAPFVFLIIALVFLSLSFAFLSSYASKSDEKKTGYYAGAINAAIFVALFQSLASLIVAISFVLASGYIIPLANAYYKELKKWVSFRAGSNSISKAFMIFNVFAALAILFAVFLASADYQASFKNELRESMHAALPAAGADTLVSKEIDKQVDALLLTPFFQSYFRWLPLITAFGAWVMLEFLRNILLSNAAGAFNKFLLKLYEK